MLNTGKSWMSFEKLRKFPFQQAQEHNHFVKKLMRKMRCLPPLKFEKTFKKLLFRTIHATGFRLQDRCES